MTDNLTRSISATPAPRPASQATTVEATRAIADVQAAAQMARVFPRDPAAATEAMQESCAQFAFADRAFFSFPRGKEKVHGLSVKFARELARCWGHIDYGVKELQRLDGRSEMLAFAWDLQTNTRAETTFIVEHRRSGKNKSLLDDVRDIYENNANMGARRMREMILAVLPSWFVEQGAALCKETLADGGGDIPLAQRVTAMITTFEQVGVSRARLEKRIGTPSKEWTPADLADMRIVYNSLKEGTTDIDTEFPKPTVTTEKLTGAVEGGEAK